MSRIKLALIAGVLAAGLSAGAQAMPVSNLAAVDTGVQPEAARYVCNAWGRCWWRPNRFYRPYAYRATAPGGAGNGGDTRGRQEAAACRPLFSLAVSQALMEIARWAGVLPSALLMLKPA